MTDDDLLLGKIIKPLCRPRPLIFDAASQFQRPGRAVDRLDVLDRIIGVETRRLDDLGRTERRRQMMLAENRFLDAVVPRRDRAQPLLHGTDFAHVATGQHRHCAKTDRAAQQVAPIEVVNDLATFGKDALIERCLRPKDRRSADADCHRVTPSGRCFGLRNHNGAACRSVIGRWTAGQHCHKALRHQQSERHMHDDEGHDRGHA